VKFGRFGIFGIFGIFEKFLQSSAEKSSGIFLFLKKSENFLQKNLQEKSMNFDKFGILFNFR